MSQVASQNTLDLSGFTGSERWYRHPLVTSLVYTDGVKYVAERAGAYWLIDKIVTAQLAAPHQLEVFQVWELKVTARTGVLTCEDGDDRQFDMLIGVSMANRYIYHNSTNLG